YILALDGDTNLQPTDLKILIEHMKMYPRVGSVSGRIHPTGTGPVVWFQKFEYAVDNWLHKTTQHVFGCLLCTPGSCSLLRAEALMDGNVMESFSTKPTKPKHYIQYDQGEDRWLTSLLLMQGWTVEYIAASNSYSTVPQTLKELFNQRRRWVPTTMANSIDLLVTNFSISMRKSPMSRLFILYELFALFIFIVTPASTCFCVAGILSFLFDLSFAVALAIALIPPAIYVGLCFKLKEETQITTAAVLSILYIFLMLVLIMTTIGSMVKRNAILTHNSIFFIPMVIHLIITTILHLKESSMVFYTWFYIICVPSYDILIFIYTVINMNCIHWGTRELKPDDDDEIFDPEVIPRSTKAHKCWIKKLQSLSCDVKLQEDSLCKEEEKYWKEVQDKHLQPFHHNKETIEKNKNDMIMFRNKISFWYFVVNVLWMLLLFIIKTSKLSPSLIKTDVNLQENGEIIQAELVGLTYLLGPSFLIWFQFFGMLCYRAQTIIDYIASWGTEPEQHTWKKKQS
ncbi:chitin synthase chs-1-like, partial [Nematolebias whitei]|uniref:chitin synthase chs-1-like n=1 Tax=Nematolebias whitei TaxID=451745 RepID=UPI0018982D3D